MNMFMYDYIAAYTFSKDGYLTPCTGTTQYSCKKKIKTFDDVNVLINEITSRIDGAKNLSVDNLIFLGKNWH